MRGLVIVVVVVAAGEWRHHYYATALTRRPSMCPTVVDNNADMVMVQLRGHFEYELDQLQRLPMGENREMRVCLKLTHTDRIVEGD